MKTGRIFAALVPAMLVIGLLGVQLHQNAFAASPLPLEYNPNPPATPVKLIFLHHSTGGYWLADNNGGLGIALRDNNYYASATNYGWGPNGVGNRTDIGNWIEWFRGSNSAAIMAAVYAESNQNVGGFGDWSRLPVDPGGENEIVMFKSCFPNSNFYGDPNQAPPPIGSNPLVGKSAGTTDQTIANAKGIYIDLLNYFQQHPEKLFIVITAPPLSSPAYPEKARLFNQWLVNDWLANYPLNNVAVFDFFNVLTTNGGDANTNDLGWDIGNHHRFLNGAIQHKTDGDNDGNPNVLEYPTGDDHPSRAGNLKATGEFIPLLNIYYNRWKGSSTPPSPTPTSPPPSGPNRIFLPFIIFK